MQHPLQLHYPHKRNTLTLTRTIRTARTANTTSIHKPSSNNERNLIILQVNINGINNKLEELKTLIKNTYADIITIQETKLTSKSNTPKVPTYTTVRADRPHKSGDGLITLIRDNITFTPTDILSTINTHNIELQMVKVHLNNTKHITIANVYIPPRDSTHPRTTKQPTKTYSTLSTASSILPLYPGAPNSAKFRGGCRGPIKIRQRGGCNNFLLFTR